MLTQPVPWGVRCGACSAHSIFNGMQIDSIDPAFAPATGTPETGGWSTRELRTILRGLDGLHIVSADIVEVAPAYDTNAELTTMAAADVSVSKPI
jgi:agmatinase